ncbi:MAG: DUF6580 family putative transport protein [Ignavibacteriaceae bacterium]|jgi:hypothetical protein
MKYEKINLRFRVLLGIVTFAAVTRILTPPLLGHPSNFAPINAIALFSGCYFSGKLAKYIIPLLSVWIGDLFIDYIYLHKFMLFYSGFYWQYACYVLMVVIGIMLSNRVKPLNLLAAGISSSVLFFIITNFGVWMGFGMYPHSTVGLAACYTAAIPFFSSTLLSDIAYSALFFGSFEFAQRKIPQLAVNYFS